MNRFTFLLLFLGATIAACIVSDEQDGTFDPDIGRIRFRVAEGHPAYDVVKDPEIGISLETERIYGCFNFSIVHDVERHGNIVAVRLTSIYKPNICLTALGPASGYSPLDLTPGTYTLRFISGSAIDDLNLVVTDSTISVSGSDTSFAIPSVTLAWRFPVRSFAYVSGTLTTTGWISSDFADSLRSSGRFTEFLMPDSGWAPYPRSPEGYWLNHPTRYFRYATESDFDTAGAMLLRFVRQRLTGQEGYGLSLQNWRNVHFRSWMMAE